MTDSTIHKASFYQPGKKTLVFQYISINCIFQLEFLLYKIDVISWLCFYTCCYYFNECRGLVLKGQIMSSPTTFHIIVSNSDTPIFNVIPITCTGIFALYDVFFNVLK